MTETSTTQNVCCYASSRNHHVLVVLVVLKENETVYCASSHTCALANTLTHTHARARVRTHAKFKSSITLTTGEALACVDINHIQSLFSGYRDTYSCCYRFFPNYNSGEKKELYQNSQENHKTETKYPGNFIYVFPYL